MFISELCCIEVLINHLNNGTPLDREIFTNFSSTQTFRDKKNNLFNIISINKLLENYTEQSPFPLEEFVYNGTIKGVYEEQTLCPDLDPKYTYNPEVFIRNLIEALKEENYILDEDGNVFVSSTKLETTVPKVWLYRLAEGYKRKTFKQLYFYNKNIEADITDKVSLIDYLRHTKTFLVSLNSTKQKDYAIEFAKAEALTNKEVENESVVKVDQLIKTFVKNVPKDTEVGIERYKLTDLFFIVSKAEAMGQEFYSKSLDEQKGLINEWIIDYINSNKTSLEAAQEFILLSNKSEIKFDNKKEIISGLINLYFTLLGSMQFEFDDVSLTNIRIQNYIPEDLQNKMAEIKVILQGINRLKGEKIQTKKELDEANIDLDQATINGERIQEIKDRVNKLINKYHETERNQESFQSTYNYLQNYIREAQKESLLDISFANNTIIKFLAQAAREGRIYLSNGGTLVNIELYNNQLGKTTFKATVGISDFLTIVENINYTLQEAYTNKR